MDVRDGTESKYPSIVFLSIFHNACTVYKHAVFAAFRIYAQRGKVVAKRGGWSLCIK